ncbi:efflux RND transporter periplasmic adaptor subunit [Idiomarina abyssalis]|uniref:efflux RND transporter periplasmic adaptor subunit n=1 Tax=Idiomarina abyssalis TaxID=86102 RepID=UPI001CD2A135|nr:efflux RND transporter periplasmic adaptor subunit [Idiomarina abyssalis]
MMTSWLKQSLIVTSLLVASTTQAQTPVEYIEANKKSIVNTVKVPTTLSAMNNSQLGFAVEGKLLELQKDTGDSVSKGDVLATLDVRQINSRIESLQAQVQSAQATLEDEKQQLNELDALAETDFVPASDLRRSRTRVQVAESQLAESRALLKETEVNQEYHELKAPYDGVITNRSADLGEWLGVDQNVFQLVADKDRYADVFLSQSYYPSIDSDTLVKLSHKEISISASIKRVVPYVDGNDRSFRVRITGDYPSDWIAGIPLTATFEIDTKRRQTAVPQDAIVRYSDGRTSVWVAKKENDNWQAIERPVELGLRFNGYVEIENGLDNGERVIVRGNEALTDGQALELTESADYD